MSRSFSRIMPVLIATTVLAIPAGAQGPSASATLGATVQIINPLSIGVTRPLDFGKIFNSTSKLVSADEARSGRLEISGQGGSSVAISMTMPSSLTLAGGTATIPVDSWTYILSPTITLAGATPSSFGASSTASTTATFDGSGGIARLYLGIGATVQAPAAAAVGTYSGVGQVTASYTDL